ncbi:hypothetical protein [Halomicrobium salinisoli]|uniref:hypothetical protein n=1 Tax=Halomicrobium salinisoli TaxID=2878391 RepID=UPI001CF0CDF2|nr:hypothetical protein [Halomicrobium salinisoli]
MVRNNPRIDRRTALKKIGATSLGALVLTGSSSSALAADPDDYEDKSDEWSYVDAHSDTECEGDYAKTFREHAFAIKKASDNSEGDRLYECTTAFRVESRDVSYCSSFTDRDDGHGIKQDALTLEVNVEENGSLWGPNYHEELGVYPTELANGSQSYDQEFENVAFSIGKAAFSSIHPATKAASIAADVVSSMGSGGNSSELNNTFRHSWEREDHWKVPRGPAWYWCDFYIESDGFSYPTITIEHWTDPEEIVANDDSNEYSDPAVSMEYSFTNSGAFSPMVSDPLGV